MRITSLADYQKTYELSVREPEKFWAGIANEFEWSKPFTKVLDWSFDDYSVKWFEDGQLNITTNCLDRHLKTIPDQAAIIYEPNEPGDEAITLTYRELHALVCKFSNVLKNQGVVKGERVHLHAHDSGTCHRCFSLCQNRSYSLGGFWRIFSPIHRGSHYRFGMQSSPYNRWSCSR